MDITIKLTQLANIREAEKLYSKRMENLKAILENSHEWIDYQDALNNVRGLEQQESILANEIREVAVQTFDGTNKKPIYGIEIKEFSVIKVLDEKKALIWASQNAPSILKLDQAKFKKAVENLELDFIEKGVEYRGQIASDLSEYLK